MNSKLSSIKILGTSITNAPKSEVLEYILKGLETRLEKFYIVTPNPEILMHAVMHKEYQDVLNHASVSLPDGIGVLISGKLLNKHIIGRITGVDMMYELCRKASKRALTVGFLGGRGNVAEKTSLCLQKKYPELIVSYAGEEWQANNIKYRILNIEEENQNSKFKTLNSKPTHIDILFVAFGFPKQEEWIAKNLSKIDVTCAMGVGGAFDYISKKVPRAPKIIQNIGMEWAFRLVLQPWRIKRQMLLPVFIWEILKERIKV